MNLHKEKQELLQWIENQHKAIAITSFEWHGFQLFKQEDGSIIVNARHGVWSWDEALDIVINLIEKDSRSLAPVIKKYL